VKYAKKGTLFFTLFSDINAKTGLLINAKVKKNPEQQDFYDSFYEV